MCQKRCGPQLWRDALWGDYSLDEAVDGGSAITASGSVDASVEGEMGATEGPIRTSDAAGPMSQVNSTSKTGSAKKVKDRHERAVREAVVGGSRDQRLLDTSKWSSMHCWEREVQLAKVWDKRDSGSGLTVAPCWNSCDVIFCWVRAPAQGWLPCKKFLAAFIAVMQRWPELPEGL
ncbi:hypothetical protein BKA93DRAFT_753792 [Sparassis latifolia]